MVSEIIGIIKNHARFCDIKVCPCDKLRFENEELSSQLMAGFERQSKSQWEDLKAILSEILNILLKNLHQRETLAERCIIHAFMDTFILNRVLNALYNIMLAEEENITFSQEFQIFCIKKSIELRMQNEGSRTTTSSETNFANIVTFYKKYMKLHELISITTNLYSQYWYEYLKSHPGTFTYNN